MLLAKGWPFGSSYRIGRHGDPRVRRSQESVRWRQEPVQPGGNPRGAPPRGLTTQNPVEVWMAVDLAAR